jgi:hypothetical protein
VPVYIYGYQDKFRALPGDDANVANHVTSGVVATSGGTPGNGVIEGAWNSTTNTEETYLFWQHVRLAGLAPGSTDITSAGSAAYIPTNALGGRLGITNSGTNVPITGMKGSYIICSNAIPGKFAKQLDITMDDGNTFSGSMQAMASSAASGVTAGTAKQMIDIVDDDTYTVCMGF